MVCAAVRPEPAQPSIHSFSARPGLAGWAGLGWAGLGWAGLGLGFPSRDFMDQYEACFFEEDFNLLIYEQ